MSWVHVDQVKRGRIQAVRNENERLIKILTDLGVIRQNMFWPGAYVIYTEAGAQDVMKSDLLPCLKPYSDCNCIVHKVNTNG